MADSNRDGQDSQDKAEMMNDEYKTVCFLFIIPACGLLHFFHPDNLCPSLLISLYD
jgi:hypothetical protein